MAESPNSTPRDELVRMITTHQTRLRGFIRCLLFDPTHAEDVLQETNMILWQKADEYRVGSDFWAWASQIARFKVLSHAKQQRRSRLHCDESFLEQFAVVVERRSEDLDQRKVALEQCLLRLPPAQRRLLELRYGSDQAVGDIARTVGRPEGSVRQTLYRVRNLLLECIERSLGSQTSAAGEPS
jgi:RNA polymerase sigma-70 factor (ECF subfamily)